MEGVLDLYKSGDEFSLDLWKSGNELSLDLHKSASESSLDLQKVWLWIIKFRLAKSLVTN